MENNKGVEVDRAEELGTGNYKVIGGPRGETTQEQYAWMETGDAHVSGLSCAKSRRAASTERELRGIYLRGKYDYRRGGMWVREIKYINISSRAYFWSSH